MPTSGINQFVKTPLRLPCPAIGAICTPLRDKFTFVPVSRKMPPAPAVNSPSLMRLVAETSRYEGVSSEVWLGAPLPTSERNPKPSAAVITHAKRFRKLAAILRVPLIAGAVSNWKPTEPNIVPLLVKFCVLEVSKGKIVGFREKSKLPLLIKLVASICGGNVTEPLLI